MVTFSPLGCEQSENLKLLVLFMIFLDYKKRSGWIFTIIGWLFSHTAATTAVFKHLIKVIYY